MSYSEFESQTNSIRLLKGRPRDRNSLIETTCENGEYSVFHEDGKFRGIRLNEYLSDLELKGTKAEELFKVLLDANQIPFLYIGQGPVGIERSVVFKEKIQSRRPDFLVNIPDMGMLFFDVKCRRKIGFPSSKETYFHLFRREMQGLINLHQQLLVPVWIAFIDESSVANATAGAGDTKFYLVPISSITKYYNSLSQKLSERELALINCVRIPDQILYSIDSKFGFRIGLGSLKDEIVDHFVICNKGLVRRIEDEVKNYIRSNQVLKSVLPDVISKIIPFAFRPEIVQVVEVLIEEKVIDYQPKQKLRLIGE